jgi:phospholipid/cholesterol/gamma-HCH transport system substrate-binding protein
MKIGVDMKARLLFAATLALLGAGALAWYLAGAARHAGYQIYTGDAVSGLIVDAPVEFHGVEVGKVRKVKLLGPRRVSVVLDIEREAPISSATVATIVSRGVAARGFTGYVYVALEDEPGAGAAPLQARPGEAWPEIRTAPAKVVTLDTAVNQVNENVQATTELLRAVLDKNSAASLRQSIDNLQRMTKVLADNAGRLESVIATAERASRRVEPLLASTQSTVDGVQDVTRRIGPLIDSSRETVRTLQDASGRVGPLLESSQQAVDAIRSDILPQVTKTVDDLNKLAASFNELAGKIERDPSVLIRGAAPARPGPGEGR